MKHTRRDVYARVTLCGLDLHGGGFDSSDKYVATKDFYLYSPNDFANLDCPVCLSYFTAFDHINAMDLD